MKRLAWAAVLPLALVTGSVLAQRTTDEGGIVISADDLHAAGITRLHDIFWLVDGARFSSVDDFTYVSSLGGHSPPELRRWALMVDGHSLEAGLWDVSNVDFGSLPLDDIFEIIVTPQPVVVDGQIYAGGVISVTTRTAERGLEATASVSATNESGDPGPFRYLEGGNDLANVDKSGPDGSLSVGLGTSSGFYRLSGSWLKHLPTDPAAFSRNRAAFDVPTTPEMELMVGSLSASARGPAEEPATPARLRTVVGRFEDMLFLESRGREIPAVLVHRSVGFREGIRIGGRRASVGASYARNDADNDPSANRQPMDWAEERLSAFASAGAAEQVRATVSTSWVRARTRLAGIHSEAAASRLTVHLQKKWLRTRGSVHIDVAAVTDGSRLGYLAGLRVRSAPRPWGSVRLGVQSYRLLDDQSGTSALWTREGMQIVPGARAESSWPASELGASLTARWQAPPGRVQIGLRGGLHLYHDLPVEVRDVVYRRPFFEVVRRAQYGRGGAAGTAEVTIASRLLNGFQRLAYSLTKPLSGDDAFRELYNKSATHRIVLSATQPLRPSIRVRAALLYQSGTSWDDYAQATQEAGASYRHVLDPFARVDLSIVKGLLGERLDFAIVVRNVLNDRIVLHPVGARLDRALLVRLTLQLP